MEYEVKISESAECDFDEIFGYIAEKLANPQAAADLAGQLEARYSELSRHPFMHGQSNDEYLRRLGYRRFIVKNYIVFYRVDNSRKEVIIARVFYGRQDYEKYI